MSYNELVINGFMALFFNLVMLPALVFLNFLIFGQLPWLSIPVLFMLVLLFVLMLPGYFSQEPNEARVMVFFGEYKGTFKNTGFFWVNPFMNKKKLSLRARNLDVEPIKVNDKIGNPILIGLVLVWKLKDTYKAMFEIDAQTMADSKGTGTASVSVAGRMNAFEDFVRVQSDAALRQVAGQYAYDDNEHDTNELTLRGGGEEINDQLERQLAEDAELGEFGNAGQEHKAKIRVARLQRAVKIAHHVTENGKIRFLMHHIQQRRVILVNKDYHLSAGLFVGTHDE